MKLIQWQWQDYSLYHHSKTNLLIHIVAVPSLLIANLSLIYALVHGAWITAALSGAIMVVSLALQGRGHKMEKNPSIPFSSPWNAISRLFVEQWINFPRFVLSGAWWRAFKNAE